MFTVDVGGPRPATFRLQLFTAPDTRPVAVATQTDSEGPSLVNRAETYVTAVWERHLTHEAEPPLWVQRQLLTLKDFDQRFELVTFACVGPFQLEGPTWDRLTDHQLTRLVGARVDSERGDGYIPRAPEPEDEPRYRTMWTVRLPRPHPFREPECMPQGISWPRRLLRQLAPRRQARTCCWYHGGDWHRVSATAIRLVRVAKRAGVPAAEIPAHVLDNAETEGMLGWELQALQALILSGDGIQLSGRFGTGYVNGQHKSQAMLDAGVRRTVVIDWVEVHSPPRTNIGDDRGAEARS
ncbi:hypothetical protein ACIBHX_46965 [Nonomuraea sp. NPDC050536]|uniref:hypothetical protein n=1 Tax=Nonomuraea sp. NPDC050536 TaxID=3364366 RepID=UPI0037C600F9